MDVIAKNRRAFSHQVASFSARGDTFGDQSDLDWMLADLPLRPEFSALDVASGTGEFARALATRVARVTALEATDAMRKRGELLLREAGVENVTFVPGVAEHLPFADGTFDIVASRYALHHFAEAATVLSEMARVSRPSGYLIIVDIVSPGENLAEKYDFYERVRDDSHTRCLGIDELETLCAHSGFRVRSVRSRITESSVPEWLDFASTPEENRAIVLDAIEKELAGGPETGLSPFEKNGAIFFRQTDVTLVGQKID